MTVVFASGSKGMGAPVRLSGDFGSQALLGRARPHQRSQHGTSIGSYLELDH